MANDPLQYDQLMESGLRWVVREALAVVAARKALPGEHHFYISFRTGFPGVDIPARLRPRFPEEMTIVLQHQFFGLEVAHESFSVTLSFDQQLERLTIPFRAITAFVDPSVQFGLQFPGQAAANAAEAAAGASPAPPKPPAPAAEAVASKEAPQPAAAEAAAEPAKVVTLDRFRKK